VNYFSKTTTTLNSHTITTGTTTLLHPFNSLFTGQPG